MDTIAVKKTSMALSRKITIEELKRIQKFHDVFEKRNYHFCFSPKEWYPAPVAHKLKKATSTRKKEK